MRELREENCLLEPRPLAISSSLPINIVPWLGAAIGRKIKRGVSFYSYQEEYYKHEMWPAVAPKLF